LNVVPEIPDANSTFFIRNLAWVEDAPIIGSLL